MTKNMCEQNLNIFFNKFSMFKSVIKYFKNNSKNVDQNYIRYNYNKHSAKNIIENGP